jgi:hypothetical protein
MSSEKNINPVVDWIPLAPEAHTDRVDRAIQLSISGLTVQAMEVLV